MSMQIKAPVVKTTTTIRINKLQKQKKKITICGMYREILIVHIIL